MLKSFPALAGIGLSLAACVAPEAPTPPRPTAPVAAQPPPSTAKFDDAPVPNRHVPLTSDTIFRFSK